MRSIALIAAAGLLGSASALAQDTPAPAPADSAAAAPAADAAPAAAPADATPAPAADAATPAPAADAAVAPAPADAAAATPAPAPDASAPPAAASGNPLEGITDTDYISILGNYDRPDRKRNSAVKYGSGASIIFGEHYSSGFGWEANYTLSALETGPGGGGDYYIHNGGGDLTYSFGDRQHLTPFVLIGGGGSFDDVHPRSNGGPSGYVDAGVGLTTGTFWHNRIRLRAEVRADHSFINTAVHNGFTDYRAGVGIEIPFYDLKPVHVAPVEPAVQVVKVPTGLEDSDGDGVVDSADKCPNTPPNTRVDGDGCPIPKVVRLEGVTFEFNKTRLRPDAQTILNWVVGIMTKYPDMQVELSGYTDSIGTDAYNLKLSQKRAEAVKQYLVVEKGLDAGRIQAKGYGKENPVAGNDTDEGRERNRRVELHILN